MLDVSSPLQRHGSIAGTGVGVTSPTSRPPTTAPPVRSMLDPTSPPPSRTTQSTTTSPTSAKSPQRHRGSSDASIRRDEKAGVDIHSDYQFDMLPSIANQALPKRVTQGGKLGTSSMATVMSGDELSSLPVPRGRNSGRHNSTVGIGGKSKSPSSRLGRSESPGLNTNSLNLMPTPGRFVTDSGKIIDMDHAYRRLSDAALLKSGGSLSHASSQNHNTRERLDSGESLSPDGGIRLTKDIIEPQAEDEEVVESSDDEADLTSGDEDWVSDSSRGRGRGRKKDKDRGDGDAEKESTLGMGRAQGPRKVKSLMAAAEEERKSHHSSFISRVMTMIYRTEGFVELQG